MYVEYRIRRYQMVLPVQRAAEVAAGKNVGGLRSSSAVGNEKVAWNELTKDPTSASWQRELDELFTL